MVDDYWWWFVMVDGGWGFMSGKSSANAGWYLFMIPTNNQQRKMIISILTHAPPSRYILCELSMGEMLGCNHRCICFGTGSPLPAWLGWLERWSQVFGWGSRLGTWTFDHSAFTKTIVHDVSKCENCHRICTGTAILAFLSLEIAIRFVKERVSTTID